VRGATPIEYQSISFRVSYSTRERPSRPDLGQASHQSN
jgi:hypothetical protein